LNSKALLKMVGEDTPKERLHYFLRRNLWSQAKFGVPNQQLPLNLANVVVVWPSSLDDLNNLRREDRWSCIEGHPRFARQN